MLFDILDLLKRYVGGLVCFDGRTLHIGSLGFRPDDESVSFTVWRSVGNDGLVEQRLPAQPGQERCAEVLTSRIAFRRFQLESLILAQNERWRQA